MDLEGLFPRVRGNYQHVLELDRCLGSIPARAGEPPLRQIQNRIKMVYPRACGGTNEKSGMGNVASGLSPRVRGNLDGAISVSNVALRGLSPRVRGTRFLAFFRVHGHGLSPRVRGNLDGAIWSHVATGSIPARAGEPDLYIRVHSRITSE